MEVANNTPIIIVFLQATAMSVPCLSSAVKALKANGYAQWRIEAYTKEDLFNKKQVQRVCNRIKEADIVVFEPHGEHSSIPGFEELYDVSSDKYVFIQPTTGASDQAEQSFNASTCESKQTYLMRSAYLHHGGTDNYVAFIRRLVADCLEQPDPDIPEAKAIPFDGIYHPDWETNPDLEDYLSWAYSRNADGEKALVLGLWFYQGYWLNRTTTAIDAVIREAERQDAIIIPVFHKRFPDPLLGNPGAPGVVEKYFKRNGEVIIDALLSPVAFSLSMYGEKMAAVYPDLGVPVFQMIATQNPTKVWEETIQAVTPMDVSISAAQPEFDGALITSVHCTRETGQRDPITGATMTIQQPVQERIRKIVALALNWARLRKLPASERKIAIIFHHYPPRNHLIGSAYGLDSFESVNRLLAAMKDEGYGVEKIWEDGEKLAFEMLDRLTNDRRYLTPDKMAARSVDQVSTDKVHRWNLDIPETPREKIKTTWGEAPGSILSHNGKYLIGGILNGHVFIGLQPIRGKGENDDLMPSQTSGLIHNPDLAPPHHYLGFYRWIKEDFGAHAVMHIGKHGTLEWLPGKSLGLSNECFPDLAIQDLPNIYPYIINNPGEGTQAKRRSYCCIIDHLIPPMTSADKAEPLQKIEDLLDALYDIRSESPNKVPLLVEKIWAAVEEKNLHTDLGITRDSALANSDAFVEKLHAYLNEVGITAINDGLHILGQPPEGNRMIETMAQYLRLPSTGAESLWEAVASCMGYDDQDLRDNPGEYDTRAGTTKGQIRVMVLDHAKALLHALSEATGSGDSISSIVTRQLARISLRSGNRTSERLERILQFVQTELRPNMDRTTEEMDNTLRAAAGCYIPPGGSGAPTRGTLDILPTGRNFYSVDPQKIPSLEAWENGILLGDALIARYLEDEGKVPEQLGMTIWASPTMRTRGDDIAEIFYLMGLKPVWHRGTGRIDGLEVIPLEKLKHPRMDITLRSSGLFRDAFPNLMELIDTGVEMVAALKEPTDMNFLARNVAAEQKEMELAGMSEAEAHERARYRIFSCKPGAYGTGTDVLLENGQWKDSDDLGEAFMQWGAYAYKKGVYGNNCYDDFRRRMGRLNLTVKNEDSREHDILVRDDWVIFQGGMNAAVKAVTGEYPQSYTTDAADPRKPKVRTSAEEARFIYRARILNPKWIEGCKRHGFKGAAEFSHAVDHSFEWDATSNILDQWQYTELAETYALNPEMQQFFKDHNPYALQAITERLLEAMERNMWENPGEYREKLQDVLLDVEGEIEDRI